VPGYNAIEYDYENNENKEQYDSINKMDKKINVLIYKCTVGVNNVS